MSRRFVFCFTPVAGASLVVLVAAVAGWVRSERVQDEYSNSSPGESGKPVVMSRGKLLLEHARVTPALQRPANFHNSVGGYSAVGPPSDLVPIESQEAARTVVDLLLDWRPLGGADQILDQIQSHDRYVIRQTIRVAMVLLRRVVQLSAALQTVWVSRFARRRFPSDHRERCGYDWRVTPGRCPECGNV